MLIWAASVAAVVCLNPSAGALECPEPPRQTQRDWYAQVKAEVGRIGWVRGAQLETRVQTATHDLMAKLPRADNVYLEQMMFSAYCSGLRDDPSLAEAEKSRLILEYRRALLAAFKR